MDTMRVIYKILKSYWEEDIKLFIKVWFMSYDKDKIDELPKPKPKVDSSESSNETKYKPYNGPYCETPQQISTKQEIEKVMIIEIVFYSVCVYVVYSLNKALHKDIFEVEDVE